MDAILEHRTEDLKHKQVLDYYVPLKSVNHSNLLNNQAYLIEGNRGVGKSMLLKFTEINADMNFLKDQIVAVYISFDESLTLTQIKRQKGYDFNVFRQWTHAKILVAILEKCRKLGFDKKPGKINEFLTTIAGNSDFEGIYDALQEFIATLERLPEKADLKQDVRAVSLAIFRKYKFQYSPGFKGLDILKNLDHLPLIKQAIKELVSQFELARVVLLFDEAAHALVETQQKSFFTIFKGLRDPKIACKAAVYPLITNYGETFEPGHDAKKITFDINELDDDYVDYFKDIFNKRIESDEKKKEYFTKYDEYVSLLAYTAFGTPRKYFTLLDMVWEASDEGTKPIHTFIQDLIKDYVIESGGLFDYHSAIGKKYKKLTRQAKLGEKFVKTVVIPTLQNSSKNRRNKLESKLGTQWVTQKDNKNWDKYSKPSIYFSINKDLLADYNIILEIMEYTNLISYRKYMSIGSNKYGKIYALNTAIAYQENIIKRNNTIENINKEIENFNTIYFNDVSSQFKKDFMVDFGLICFNCEKDRSLDFKLCPYCGFKFEEDEINLYMDLINTSVYDLPLNPRAKNALEKNPDIKTLKDLKSKIENNEKMKGVGSVLFDQLKTIMEEYLQG